jgi:hypothetical protein
MRDRDSWLNATMIELADTGNGSFDESAYVGNFTERLAELLGPAEVCLLLLPEPAATAGGGKAAAGGRRSSPRRRVRPVSRVAVRCPFDGSERRSGRSAC